MSNERRDFWRSPTIAELRGLLDKASPVPWYPTTTAGQSGALTCHASGPDHPRPNQLDWHPQAVADSYLIAAMRNSLWQLLDVVSDLAEKPEPVEWYPMGGIYGCTLCDGKGTHDQLDFRHAPECPWRRACEMT